MIWFPAYPNVRKVRHRWFRYQEPYVIEWMFRGVRYRLIIPTGFECDFGSIPQILWSLFNPDLLDKAAGFHDFLTRYGGHVPPGTFHKQVDGEWVNVAAPWSRRDGDRFFGVTMREDPDGPGRIRRRLAVLAVRVWGWRPWDRRFV